MVVRAGRHARLLPPPRLALVRGRSDCDRARGAPARRPSARARAARRSPSADAGHRQPVRDDDVRPAASTSSSTRCRAATRSRRSTPSAAATRPSCAARPPARATTSSSPSAATARSTRPPTASPARDTPLTCLPGGATNVYCRDARHPQRRRRRHRAPAARSPTTGRRARSTSARVNGRWFTFAAGVGLDASVVERVDRHPHLKARFGAWYYAEAGDRDVPAPLRRQPAAARGRGRRRGASSGVSAFVQNAEPYTYFRRRPIDARRGRRSSTPATSPASCCARAAARRADGHAAALLSARGPDRRATAGVAAFDGVREADACARRDGRPMPLQVDGDHIGDDTEAVAQLPGRLPARLTACVG